MSTERERFEAWAKGYLLNTAKREDGTYEWISTYDTWSAWQSALSAPAVPPGYVLVPVEPTDAMIDATYHGQPLADIWHDMIAAAPSAKEQPT